MDANDIFVLIYFISVILGIIYIWVINHPSEKRLQKEKERIEKFNSSMDELKELWLENFKQVEKNKELINRIDKQLKDIESLEIKGERQ